MEWRNQTAVVTGGARGLGRATARLLAQRGAAVCVNYAVQSDAAETLVAEISSRSSSFSRRRCASRIRSWADCGIRALFDRAENVVEDLSEIAPQLGTIFVPVRHLEDLESCFEPDLLA